MQQRALAVFTVQTVDDDVHRRGLVVQWVAAGLIGVCLALLPITVFGFESIQGTVVLLGGFGSSGLAAWLARRGWVTAGALLLISTVFLGVQVPLILAARPTNSLFFLPLVTLIAGATLRPRLVWPVFLIVLLGLAITALLFPSNIWQAGDPWLTLLMGLGLFGVSTIISVLGATSLYRALAALRLSQSELERLVVERTQALEAALAASRQLAEQHDYLATLHQTTLDLLHRRAIDDLLQAIVDRAALTFNAPCVELMLAEGDDLVMRACTANHPVARGSRLDRAADLVTWHAYDSRQPAVLADYPAWPHHRTVYDAIPLHAVANIPILIGDRPAGVLALGRAVPGQPFTLAEVQRAQQLAQLLALVLDTATLLATLEREVAERSAAEQALLAQNDELSAFAHTVAHDLKSPLMTVQGYGDLLLTSGPQLDAAERDTYVQYMVAGGQAMERIIDELLLLATIRALDDVVVTALDMDAVLNDLELRLQRLISQQQATLVRPDHWPVAYGYAPWVAEVWANYISNAIKYGGQPPLVTLGADIEPGGWVRYWVRDNGPGLSAAQQERLFTPFTRLHHDRARGHGLGLSIVQRIVARLGGEVGVVSAPGQGSTFFFSLPAAATDVRRVGDPPGAA